MLVASVRYLRMYLAAFTCGSPDGQSSSPLSRSTCIVHYDEDDASNKAVWPTA